MKNPLSETIDVAAVSLQTLLTRTSDPQWAAEQVLLALMLLLILVISVFCLKISRKIGGACDQILGIVAVIGVQVAAVMLMSLAIYMLALEISFRYYAQLMSVQATTSETIETWWQYARALI